MRRMRMRRMRRRRRGMRRGDRMVESLNEIMVLSN